jgi:hypothetical protein
VDPFGWILVGAVPVLYGLFWWLDYRWQAAARARALEPPKLGEEDEI